MPHMKANEAADTAPHLHAMLTIASLPMLPAARAKFNARMCCK
jgi:hypothetical protein